MGVHQLVGFPSSAKSGAVLKRVPFSYHSLSKYTAHLEFTNGASKVWKLSVIKVGFQQ